MSLQVREDGTAVIALAPASWLRVVRGPRVLADEAVRRYPAACLVNGPMVRTVIGTDLFLLRDGPSGLSVPSRVPDQGATVWTVRGEGGAAYGGRAPSDATVAVQGWPSLVVGGQVTARDVNTNAERDTRAGIGLTRDGRVLIVYAVGTMVALAERMQREGAWVAAYLDGGSSSQLRAGGVRRDSPRAVPIPQWVLLRDPGLAPTPPPTPVEGPSPWAVLAVAVASALVARWARRARPFRHTLAPP